MRSVFAAVLLFGVACSSGPGAQGTGADETNSGAPDTGDAPSGSDADTGDTDGSSSGAVTAMAIATAHRRASLFPTPTRPWRRLRPIRRLAAREDLAETMVPYLAVRFRSERIGEDVSARIQDSIPNRLLYLDCQADAGATSVE